ncbi:hypothetical protein [Rhizomonospora bruguierae]|uniref:hypothetical protein n=1 Tax=Rhizomonospora bruguierae TaxID=1581705 RepID=UPI001BCB82D5|nr:hypothetical protein [Micromonospora sp. NBRC 107566]
MRHLFSLLVSLILAPAIWLGVGVGGNRVLAARTGNATPQHPDALLLLFGLAVLLAAGLLYALLVLARLSPVGPVLAGLAYLGATGWAMFAYDSFRDLVPTDLGSLTGVGEVPAGGVAALLAVPLLLTLFSPRRWRRHETTAAQPVTPAYSGPAAYPYQQPGYVPAPQPLPDPTLDETTTPLYGGAPRAYPPPGHAGATPAPMDPDDTRRF